MELLLWWVGQMRTLLPAGWFGIGWQKDALIIKVDRFGDDAAGEAISGSLLLRREGRETQIQQLNFAQPAFAAPVPNLDTILRLPRDAVLCREVVLPLAAGRHLQTSLEFEVDRLTPFAADEVYWGVSNLTRDRARGRLSLQFTLVMRAPVQALCQSLAQMRLAPSFIETETGRIALAPNGRQQTRSRATLLSVICAALVISCIVTPFIRQQFALDAASRAIEAFTPEARTALSLRRQLEAAASGRAAIADAQRSGDALQVLATLTGALPDGTWLTDLTLKSGDLTFDGQSSAAAGLIARLSSLPGLRNPSFTAPVTRTWDGKADLFSLHATVGP